MGVGNLLRNHKDVERVLAATKNYAGILPADGNSVIDSLSALKQKLEKLENQFYKNIRKTKEQFQLDYQTAYSELEGNRNKLYQIEQIIVEEFGNFSSAVNQEELIEKFQKKVNEDFYKLGQKEDTRQIYESIINLGNDAVLQSIIDIVSHNSALRLSSKTSRKSPYSSKQQKIALGKMSLSFSKQRAKKQGKKQDEQPFHIELKDGEVLTTEYVNKIEQYLKKDSENSEKETDKIDRVLFDTRVAEELRKFGINWIAEIVLTDGKQIFVNRNKSVIKGYFGELYAHAILKKLFGDRAIPTGSIKKASSGQSIPIDEVLRYGLEYYHFQVKNYQAQNGTITLHGSSSAMNFLQNRLIITGSPLEILTEFFASYQYNQPFDQEERHNSLKEGEMSIEEYRNQVYSQFQTVFLMLETFFNKRIGNILKIEDCFSASSGGAFKTEKDYYNNFFIIQGKIIPASEIIEQIQLAMMTYGPSKGGQTTYNLQEPTDKSMVLQKFLSQPNYQPNLNLLARKIKIDYSITIQV